MIISKTNVSLNATITATPDSDLQDINVITDGDYSSVYTDTLTTSVKITFDFPTPQEIGYIAISGNVSTKDRITIRSADTSQQVLLCSSEPFDLFSSDGFRLGALYENSIDDSLLGLSENRVMMYQTDIEASSEIEIEIFGSGQISISEISMGEYYEVPNDGEQSGYNRPWTVPNIAARSASGLDNSPINLSYESRPLNVTLRVPNNKMVDFDGWYEMIVFAANNTFYILEDDDKFHSYVGFNAVPSMTQADSRTRKLGTSAIQFQAYAKATEALL